QYAVNDAIGFNTTALADLGDQRIAIDQASREGFRVCDLLFQPDDRNLEVAEARVDQGLLYWIDLMVGERYVVELRRIRGEEATSNFMSDPAERIGAMLVPDVEQIAPTGSEHPMDLLVGFRLVREEHHAKL